MNKLIMMIKYNLRVQWTMTSWYLVIYPVSMLVVYIGLIKTSLITESSGSLIYRIWGSVVFLFAISIRFREDFDFMLTLSNTRRNIFIAKLYTVLGISAFFSGLIVLERVIVDHINHVLGYHNITDPLHLFAPYAVNNLFLQFVYFLMLCTCCCAAGVLLGSLFYRFGKNFMLVFWLVFSALPLLIFPFLLLTLYQESELAQSMAALGNFLKNFNVLAGSGVLLILTIILCMALGLNMRRLPQQ